MRHYQGLAESRAQACVALKARADWYRVRSGVALQALKLAEGAWETVMAKEARQILEEALAKKFDSKI